jgi:Ca2+-binding EF-hand superfamily protein
MRTYVCPDSLERRATMKKSAMNLLGGLAVVCSFAPVALAGGGEWSDREFKMMDTNGDGKISADEHAAGAKTMFAKMDENKDGKVTSAEMDASHEKVTGAKAHKGSMNAVDKIKAIDTNNDGVLTAEEHAAGAKMMFDKMDTDKDGYLSKTEMEAGHKAMMGAHDKGRSDKDLGTK